jgi:type II secretory pathway component PulK
MDPPYFAKDGPFDDLSELLLVRGVNSAMYWGSSGTGSRTVILNRPATLSSAFDEPVYAVGLVDLLTALSGRLLNVNTASARALQVIPEIDENVAQAIITARAGPDGAEGNEDDTPFRSGAEVVRVPGLNPAAAPLFQQYFTANSLMFEARVTVTLDSIKRDYVAMLRRNSQREIQILRFYWN